MKTDPPNDVPSDEPTPEAFRTFVRARQNGPAPEALERMATKLTRAGVLGREASHATTTVAAQSRLASFKVGMVALALAGGFLAWRATETRSFVTPETPARSAPSVVDVASAPANEPATAAPALPVLSVDQLPSAAPVARATAASSTATTAKPTELELVQRAQAAIGSDPERALAVTTEHARAYPTGAFVQEREVIAVEALARLGRSDEATKRAVALVRRFPRTPYATRLERALGRPLPEPSNTPPSTTP